MTHEQRPADDEEGDDMSTQRITPIERALDEATRELVNESVARLYLRGRGTTLEITRVYDKVNQLRAAGGLEPLDQV